MNTTVITWNVAWASPESVRGREIRNRIASQDPNIICLTETYTHFLSDDGYVICSQADYGCRAPSHRRKVLLWSKKPWHEVDEVGQVSLPTGRFVAGATMTDTGLFRFIGVCVPWRDAHVRTGRRDRTPWEDHLIYLRGLVAYSQQGLMNESIMLGDFNQTIPRRGAPVAAWNALAELLSTNLAVATSGLHGNKDKASIDHVLVGPGVVVRSVETLSNETSDGFLSDHFGVKVVVARTKQV